MPFATHLSPCGARCRCCSEARPAATCHMRNTSGGSGPFLIMSLPGDLRRYCICPDMHPQRMRVIPCEHVTSLILNMVGTVIFRALATAS